VPLQHLQQVSKNNPIGIFDSGIGGLTVANAIASKLPLEDFIYFGDTAHLPYGDKSSDAICYYSLRITRFLIEKGCKMIVIACNSASATAAKVLHEFYGKEIPIINVIDPLVNYVVDHKYQKIGVIATKVTTQSNIYPSKIHALNPDIDVRPLATPLLVPMIEEGFISNNISKSILENYLSNEMFSDIEALVLACTHFPLLKPAIKAYFNEKIDILDSTDVVLTEIENTLEKYGLKSEHRAQPHQFYVSDFTESFEKTTKIFYKEEIHLEHAAIW